MLTPVFELCQDETFVTIVIRAPFTKISDTEIFIDGTDFKFYSKPYFLRLCLPGRIIEDGRETARYDSEKGTFIVRVAKECPGERFEDLDMLTKLLSPKGLKSAKLPTIQVTESGSDSLNGSVVDVDDVDDFDWHVEQEVATTDALPLTSPCYGFANLRCGVFSKLQSEFTELIDLQDPDCVPLKDRCLLRIRDEDEKFDDDYYLADLYQNDSLAAILKYIPPWTELYEKVKLGKRTEDIVKFTDKERETLKNLTNKEYLNDNTAAVYLSLVDIIFAFAYNHRINEGENNVESGWTICKLSATLSWLDVFTSVKEVVTTCFRRSLSYPLYRHWDLCKTVLKDTISIFFIGKHQLLKCLLEIHSILQETEQRYILNDLYITDYCVWIQTADEKKLKTLAKTLEEIQIEKTEVGFSLEELESAAEIVIKEQSESNSRDVDRLTSSVAKLVMCSQSSVRDSDDDSTDTQDDDKTDTENDDKTDTQDDDKTDTQDDDKTDTEDDDKIDTQNDDRTEKINEVHKVKVGFQTESLMSQVDT